MEKDFKVDSNSEDSSGENPEDQELSSIEREMILMAKTQSLQEQFAVMDEEMKKTQKMLNNIEDFYLHRDISQSQTLPLTSSVSPLGSPIQESSNLPKDKSENSPNSNLRHPFIASYNIIKSIEKTSEEISNKLKNFEAVMASNAKFLTKPLSKTSDNETRASRSCIESDTRQEPSPELEIIETVEGSSRFYVGKGKEAASKSFRYKKRSKTDPSRDSPGKEAANPTHRSKEISKSNDSSDEALVKDYSVKRSEETPESKTLASPQSSDVKISKLLSPLKRKGSDSPEETLDESCDRTSTSPKLSENRAEDDLNIAKKVKLEDDDKISKQYPTLTAMLDQKNYESIDLAVFMDQTSSEVEQLNFPTTSGLSNVVESISNSEESSLASGNENTPCSDREESSLTSGSDMSSIERGESSLSNINEDTSVSENGDSQHFQS